MRGYGLFFYIAEAFRGLRANSMVNLLAVGTITMAMLIVGFFLLIFFNIRGTMTELGTRLEISVYLREAATTEEREFLEARLKAEPGVKKVVYLPKEQALALFRRQLKGQEALLDGLKENPLPSSYEVSLQVRAGAASDIEDMARKFARLPGVEDVSYGRQGAETLAFLLALLLYGGASLALLLGVSVVFIISNSVRLALYSRGSEIELMQWIGATRGFIQGPFIVEGMLIAMLGSSLGVAILAGVFYSLPREAVVFLSQPYGLAFLPPAAIASIIAVGAVLGITGAMVSVGRFLE